MTRKVLRVLGAAGVISAAACRDAARSLGPAPEPDVPVMAQALQAPDVASLRATVPGFGGFYLDGGGATVYLTDIRQRGAAEGALAAYGQVRVLQGDYTYEQLDHWFQRLSPEALALRGAVFVDLDEAKNRVLVGVEHAAAAAAVRGLVARLGLPGQAVVVAEVEPIRFAATLRDQVRPVRGGLQINFTQYLCTLGFNADRSGQASFIVNSHCTQTQGGTEGTLYYQPLASVAGSFIGTEVHDPKYFRGGACPRGWKCRYSDAARAAYASGVSFDLGGIARTSGPNNSALDIVGDFRVVGEGSAPVGAVVNKIGRTTGWTQGTVTNTCVNTAVSGTNIVQLCQTFVSAGVGPGDSGSPVFGQSGTTSATLLGILWGGNSSGTLFVYSPIANIERELGALTTN